MPCYNIFADVDGLDELRQNKINYFFIEELTMDGRVIDEHPFLSEKQLVKYISENNNRYPDEHFVLCSQKRKTTNNLETKLIPQNMDLPCVAIRPEVPEISASMAYLSLDNLMYIGKKVVEEIKKKTKDTDDSGSAVRAGGGV